MGDATDFLLENESAIIGSNNGNPIFLELPQSVVLEVTYTEPGLQGDRSQRWHQARDARDGPRDSGAAVP